MNEKKDTTKKKTAASTPPINRFEQALSRDLSAVLSNPYIPKRLADVITDELSKMFAEVPPDKSMTAPDAIERILNFHQGFGFRNVN